MRPLWIITATVNPVIEPIVHLFILIALFQLRINGLSGCRNYYFGLRIDKQSNARLC